MLQQNWYIVMDGRQVGPLSPSDVRRLAAQDRITPESQVRKATMQGFVPARRVKGLFPDACRRDPVKQETTPVAATPLRPEPRTASRECKSRVPTARPIEPDAGTLRVRTGSVGAQYARRLGMRRWSHTGRQALAGKSKPAKWKLPAGLLLLTLGAAMQFVPVLIALAVLASELGLPLTSSVGVNDTDQIVARFIVCGAAILLTFVIVAMARPLSNGRPIFQAFYMIVFGIIPGYAVLKGWEAIRESG